MTKYQIDRTEPPLVVICLTEGWHFAARRVCVAGGGSMWSQVRKLGHWEFVAQMVCALKMLYLDVYWVADVVCGCILCDRCCIWMYTVWQMLYLNVYCVAYVVFGCILCGRCCIRMYTVWQMCLGTAWWSTECLVDVVCWLRLPGVCVCVGGGGWVCGCGCRKGCSCSQWILLPPLLYVPGQIWINNP